ncbi:MAG TPA: branched-chain amino acid ABC transporter permease [Firmicutes bacterium]|nr:branched-chain amino acid ABC transporter permease [Bacillota bacterium]
MSKVKTSSVIKLIIGAAILLLVPVIVPNSYIMQLVLNILVYVILAMGLNLLTGFTGILSLGHAAFFGIGAYASGILNTRLGWPFWATLIISVVITALLSLLLAFPALRVKGTYLVLMTIGFGEVVRLLLVNWIALTNGPNGIVGISYPDFGFFKLTNMNQCYYLALIFAVLLMLYLRVLMKSRVGRCLLAIRDDDRAAELVGIDVSQYKLKAFMISAAYCAIAGSLYAHVIRFISPDSFRADESQLILCCVIIGGIGTFKGPVIGAILLTIIPELFRSLADFRMVLYGVILMIVIIFFPGGVARYWDLLVAKIKGLVTGSRAKKAGAGK